jgi:hypothetical protein
VERGYSQVETIKEGPSFHRNACLNESFKGKKKRVGVYEQLKDQRRGEDVEFSWV